MPRFFWVLTKLKLVDCLILGRINVFSFFQVEDLFLSDELYQRNETHLSAPKNRIGHVGNYADYKVTTLV
jgi:hypothetical protein